jgi:hypothetical protein
VILADVYAATYNCPTCLSQPGEVSEIAPGFTGDNFHPGDVGHARIAESIIGNLLIAEGGSPVMANNCTSVCCINGLTATPSTTDPSVCNAGKGAIFVGSTGQTYIRMAISSPCAAGDWEPLSGSIRASSGLTTLAADVLTGPTAVSFQEFAERASITLVNPSAYRAMNVLLVGNVSVQLSISGGSPETVTFAFDSRFYIDGVAQGIRPGGIINHDLAAGDFMEFGTTNAVSFDLAAGDSIVVELAGIYSAGVGFNGVTVSGTAIASALAVFQ